MEQDETQLIKFNHQTLNVNQVRFVIVLQFHILLQTMSCHEYHTSTTYQISILVVLGVRIMI